MVSPDGARLAYTARGADGKITLYVRRLDDGSALSLAGTDNAFAPFWSADSKFLGYFSSGKLRKIDAAGGPPQIVCDARAGRGGTWNAAGDIVFAPTDRDPLFRVSAAGGTPVPLTALDRRSEFSHRWPTFLPDGRHFLYTAQTFGSPERGHIFVGSIDGKERKQIVNVNSPAMYANGHLLYVRDDTLLAQKFDPKSLATTSDPVVVADNIYAFRVTANEAFSASPAGILAYFQGSGPGIPSRIVWRDRDGKEVAALPNAGEYQQPQLSHDQRRIAYALWAKDGSDIWIYDVARQVPTRFTFGPGLNTNAVWSPDDTSIVYASEDLQRGTRTMMRKPASGVGAPDPLFVSASSFLGITDWTSDGRYVIAHFDDTKLKTGADVYAYSIPEKRLVPIAQTPASECCGRVSPDVRWIAYSSNETGKNEVYVQPFPVATGRWQISNGGGTQPRWTADGKQIFYSGPDNRIYAVDVHATPSTFEPGVPKALFAIRPKPGGWPFDVTRDGKFLINEAVVDQATSPVTVVLNWTAKVPK